MVATQFFALAGLLLSDGAWGVPLEPPDPRTTRRRMWMRWACCVPLLLVAAAQMLTLHGALHEAQAMAFRRARNYPGSVTAALAATRDTPYDAKIWRGLAESLLALGDADPGVRLVSARHAVEAADRAVRLDPDRAVNHDTLARSLLMLGRDRAAARALRDGLACDPVNYPSMYNALAGLYFRAKDDAAATRILETVAERYPDDVFQSMWFFRRDLLRQHLSTTWLMLGSVALRARGYRVAQRDFERAVDMDPVLIQPRFEAGMLEMSLGEPGLAFRDFVAIQREKPRHAVTLWLLGSAYREMGQVAMSARLLGQAVRIMPALAKGVEIPPDFFKMKPRPGASTWRQIEQEGESLE